MKCTLHVENGEYGFIDVGPKQTMPHFTFTYIKVHKIHELFKHY